MSVVPDVISGTEVNVTWQAPAGSVDLYKLTLTSGLDSSTVTETGTNFLFVGLATGTEYGLRLQSQAGPVVSAPVETTFITSECSASLFG